MGDCDLVGKAGCASSLESESILRKRSRISEGLPSGACWPALVRLTPGASASAIAAERHSRRRTRPSCWYCSISEVCSRAVTTAASPGGCGSLAAVIDGGPVLLRLAIAEARSTSLPTTASSGVLATTLQARRRPRSRYPREAGAREAGGEKHVVTR